LKSNFQFRIRLLSVGIIVFALFLIARLYLLQVVHGNDFIQKADRQYVQQPGTTFDRGTIYFTDKDGTLISAATLKSGFTVAINPKLLKEPAKAYEELHKLLPDLNEADFLAAAKMSVVYVEIATRVESSIGTAVDALKIPGVSIYKSEWRFYPGNTLAAHALGIVAYKGDQLAGRYGLERTYDSTLSRTNNDTYVNSFAEIFSNISKTISNQQSLEGDIVTTIEPTVQSTLENELKKVRAQYSSESAGGIIINPKNGEIYAMTLTPSFDPNNFTEEKSSAVFSNDLVENVHEMGSIVKPFTYAAGLDMGLISAKTMYNDTGSVSANNKTVYNFDQKGRGYINLQQALGQSLNTGAVFVEQKLGNKNFSNYLKKFGLGEKTGIDLPNENSGLISNLDTSRDIEHYTASFGQGIAMTPVEMVRGESALANGGHLVTPHLVKEIDYKLGFSKNIEPPLGPQVIQASTSEAITKMLVEDFDTYLQAGHAKNPHYSIAEKTGTAQIALPGGGGYYPDRYLHSFFGYLPAYNPQFLVFMYTVYPKGVQFSSETLAPAFIDLTKFLINYYQIPPDR
jgi:stage V sporulation protein D (sporulation-specific penicillin-binding protein)